MIRMLVGNCHVADSQHKVLAYVISKIKGGRAEWKRFARPFRREVVGQVIRQHKENRQLYMDVMYPSYKG